MMSSPRVVVESSSLVSQMRRRRLSNDQQGEDDDFVGTTIVANSSSSSSSSRPCPHCTSSTSYFQLDSSAYKLKFSFSRTSSKNNGSGSGGGGSNSNNEITSFLLVLVLTSILFTITLADESVVVDEPSLYRRTTTAAPVTPRTTSSSQSIVFTSKPFKNATSGGGGGGRGGGGGTPTSTTTTSSSCHQSNIMLEYDQGLFDELKMSDTLLNLYRSCYKEKFNDELRRPLFKTGFNENNNNRSCNESSRQQSTTGTTVSLSNSKSGSGGGSGSGSSTKKQPNQMNSIPKHREILIELLMDKSNSIIPVEVQKRIDLVCDNNNNNNNDNQKSRDEKTTSSSSSSSILMDYLDKIYLLADYEHDLCGNVFKNSIKHSYLKDYVLRIKDDISSSNKTSRQRSIRLFNQNNNINIVQHQKHRHHRAAALKSTTTTLDYSTSLVFEMADEIDEDEEDQMSREKRDVSGSGGGRVRTSLFVERGGSSSKSRADDMKQKIVLNNCTMILLNLHLLSFKTSCDFEDFAQILQHYDCLSNFSVNSNCSKCQSAYGKWLCSSNLPYYDGEKASKPCLRYCFNVQNQCPFFRPADHYGGQPVFTCSNVIQATESRPEGYEDDDENYYDDDLNDDDQCYTECSDSNSALMAAAELPSLNRTKLSVDLTGLFNQTLSRLDDKRISAYLFNESLLQQQQPYSPQLWPQLRQLIVTTSHNSNKTAVVLNPILNSFMYSKTAKYRWNERGRYVGHDECLFNLKSDVSFTLPTISTLLATTTISILLMR